MTVRRDWVVALVLFSPISAAAAVQNTAAMAIKLADKACAASWGKESRRYGTDWKVDPKRWHARIVGDHWKVWTGDEKAPGLSISIPLLGSKVDPDMCDLHFQD